MRKIISLIAVLAFTFSLVNIPAKAVTIGDEFIASITDTFEAYFVMTATNQGTNNKPDFVITAGNWTKSTNAAYYGSKAYFGGGTGLNSATANIVQNLPSEGIYEFYYHISGLASAIESTGMPLTVNYSGGTKNYSINMTETVTGKWKKISTNKFNAGNATVNIPATLPAGTNRKSFSGAKFKYIDAVLSASSTEYTVSSNNITIVQTGKTVSEVLSNITYPVAIQPTATIKTSGGATKNATDIVLDTDILNITRSWTQSDNSTYSETKEYTLIVSPFAIKQDSNLVLSNNVISQIPYGTSKEQLVDKLVYDGDIEIYTGNEINNGIIKNNDILKHIHGTNVNVYTLQVLPISSDNILTSNEYTIDNNENKIKNIPYSVTFQELKGKIVAPKYAEVKYNIPDNYVGKIASGEKITVIAQNGDERIYTIVLNDGYSSSSLSSTIYSVVYDEPNKTISNVNVGTSVSDFKNNLAATNNGIIRVFDPYGLEITTGNLTSNATVRVYFEMPNKFLLYDEYKILYNKSEIFGEQKIVTINDKEFTSYNLTFNQSSSSVDKGYNGINTIYPTILSVSDSAYSNFSAELSSAGQYDVYVYTSKILTTSQNTPRTVTLKQNGDSKISKSIDFTAQTGWQLIGRCDLNSGNSDVTISESKDGANFTRLSAVKFSKVEKFYIKDAKINSFSLENTQIVNNDVANIQLTFSHQPNQNTLNKDNIKIISENGNDIDYSVSFDGNSNVLSIITNEKLANGTKYKLDISQNIKANNSDTTLSPSLYNFETSPVPIYAMVTNSFEDSRGMKTKQIQNAKKVNSNIVLYNTTLEQKSVDVYLLYYGQDTMIGYIKNKKTCTIAPNSFSEESLSIDDLSDYLNENRRVKILVWDDQGRPISKIINLQ